MTETDRYEIAVLAEAAHNARERYLYASNMNSPPPGTPEAAKSAVAYEMIRTELMIAEAALRKAQLKLAQS